jgi:microcystin-dependent protein
MSEPFVAEIRIFACNFAPTGWAQCNGQLLPISQNTALFSLLGTTYGGDGKSTFGLPDLQGNAPMHAGQGAGLTPRDLGELGGEQNVTLIQNEVPAHNHRLQFSDTSALLRQPGGALAAHGAGVGYYSEVSAGSPTTQLAPSAVSIAGSGLPHNNMQPSLCLTFCIALQGVFPPRS